MTTTFGMPSMLYLNRAARCAMRTPQR
jgi:hypothetical protein